MHRSICGVKGGFLQEFCGSRGIVDDIHPALP